MPCVDMLVTSTIEVSPPSGSERIFVPPYDSLGFLELSLGETIVVRKRDVRFKPEFRLSVRTGNMDVHP